MANATLATVRQFAAGLAGPFYGLTADGSGCTTTTLSCSAFPVKSTISRDKLFEHFFLYRPNAVALTDKDRLVTTGGYAPSTGTLQPDLSWTNAPTSEAFELHGLLSGADWATLINQALWRCYVVVEFTLTPVLLQTRHSLASAAPWLSNDDWVYQVGVLTNNLSRDLYDPYSFGVRGYTVNENGVVYIVHPGRSFNSNETIYIRAIRPGYTYVQPLGAGNFGDQTTGLSAETDVVPISKERIGYATLVELWERFGNVLSQDDNKRLKMSQIEAAGQFTRYTEQEFDEPERTFRPAHFWGTPRWGSLGWG